MGSGFVRYLKTPDPLLKKERGSIHMKLDKKDVHVTFRIPADVDQRMDYMGEQFWTNKSSVYRDAVRLYLREHAEYFTDEYMRLNQHHNPTTI